MKPLHRLNIFPITRDNLDELKIHFKDLNKQNYEKKKHATPKLQKPVGPVPHQLLETPYTLCVCVCVCVLKCVLRYECP